MWLGIFANRRVNVPLPAPTSGLRGPCQLRETSYTCLPSPAAPLAPPMGKLVGLAFQLRP